MKQKIQVDMDRYTKFLYKKYYLNGYEPEINIGNRHPVKVKL